MPETKPELLSGVAETLLIPLYMRAMESQRPDALVRDEKAVALVTQLASTFPGSGRSGCPSCSTRCASYSPANSIATARDFLSRHPEAVVVHIGCGLDSRFERVDNGRVEWYDLDLPEVIALRRKLPRR